LRKIIILITKVGISIGLLIILFKRIDTNLKETLFYIRTADPLYFFAAALLFIFVIYLGLARWNIFLKSVKKDLPYSRIFVSFCGGLFFNVFLPSSIGGDIVRTTDLSLHTKDSSSIFATVFLDRIVGFVGLVLVAFLGFILGYFYGLRYSPQLFLFMLIFTALLISILASVFSKKFFNLLSKLMIFGFLKRYFTKFHERCYSFRFQKVTLIKTILLSFLLQVCFSTVYFLVGLSLGIKIDIIHYLIFVPIISSVTVLPISIGGLGLRDNTAVVLFSTLGVAADKVVAMTLINFAFLFFVGIAGGLIYAIVLYGRKT